MAEVMRFAAPNVQEGVVPDSGHWVMELNPNHEIIAKLRDQAEDATFDDFAEVLYGYALLAEGSELTDPLKFNQALVRVLAKA